MPASPSEIERLVQARPGSGVTQQPDGSSLVHVPDVALPPGWTTHAAAVWWLLSPGYPSAQPDCFFADAELRLAGGAQPVNTGLQPLNGVPLLWFSWHLQFWRPGRDDLVSYLHFIERRFTDAR